jgi:uncharacterized protein (DUF1778 family)
MMGAMSEPHGDRLTIRIEPELRAAIEAAAEADRRTVSNFVRCALADAVQDRAAPAREEAA